MKDFGVTYTEWLGVIKRKGVLLSVSPTRLYYLDRTMTPTVAEFNRDKLVRMLWRVDREKIKKWFKVSIN